MLKIYMARNHEQRKPNKKSKLFILPIGGQGFEDLTRYEIDELIKSNENNYVTDKDLLEIVEEQTHTS